RVDVRREDLAVEELQLTECLIEAIGWNAYGDERAAVVALAGLAHGEDVAAKPARDGARLVGGRPRILSLHRDIRGQDQVPVRVRDERRDAVLCRGRRVVRRDAAHDAAAVGRSRDGGVTADAFAD